MGRESINDPIVIQSSIALLQERFRQLERMKEMREERELLRKLAEPKQCNPTSYEPSGSGLLFFHLLTPRSPPPPTRQVPNFSLWSGSQPQGKCPPPSSLHISLNKFRDSDCSDDVDTSLHL